jgi:GT2 family glycosyltransferase
MDLTFNIIYTRGTVRYLRLLVFSLLKWSESSFRLVANACSPEEVRLLQELCYKNSRLEFLALPSERGMQHSEVLSYLQALERLDHFCFMDSDIIATGDFVNEMLPYLDNHAAVFSAPPLWCTEEEQILPDTFPVMGGRFNRTSSGLCIGSTHFAQRSTRGSRDPAAFCRFLVSAPHRRF